MIEKLFIRYRTGARGGFRGSWHLRCEYHPIETYDFDGVVFTADGDCVASRTVDEVQAFCNWRQLMLGLGIIPPLHAEVQSVSRFDTLAVPA